MRSRMFPCRSGVFASVACSCCRKVVRIARQPFSVPGRHGLELEGRRRAQARSAPWRPCAQHGSGDRRPLRRGRPRRGRPDRRRRAGDRRRATPRSSTSPAASSCPGFIDSHRHTWETVIRGIAPDVSLGGYFDLVLDQLAPAYRPEDVYAGNYLGSLEAIDAGVTTLLDWSHINNTPEHADEAIRGLRRRAAARRLLLRQPEHARSSAWWYDERARGARGHPPRARALLLERRRPDDARDGHPRPRLLQAGGRQARLGARPRRRSADQRPRRHGPLRRPVLDGLAAERAGPARARTRPTSTATTSPTRSSS